MVDPDALEILKKAQTTLFGLKSYSARCETLHPATDPEVAVEWQEISTLIAVKPNKMRYEQKIRHRDPEGQWYPTRHPGTVFVSDGKTLWQQFGTTYRLSNRTRPAYLHTGVEPWGGFFSDGLSPYLLIREIEATGKLLELLYDGSETVDDVIYDKVFTHYKTTYEKKLMEFRAIWYVGHDGLIRRKVEDVEIDGKPGLKSDALLKDIQINASEPIDESVFSYKPPRGVKRKDDPAP